METFRKMRESIIEKTLDKDPEIYLGLHSIGNALSKIYIDRYKGDWLLSHFETYKKIIDDNILAEEKEYKEECIEYFSKIFLDFSEAFGECFTDPKIAIELLKENERVLTDMISFSENCEKNYNLLCVNRAKNKEKLKMLKRKMIMSNDQ